MGLGQNQNDRFTADPTACAMVDQSQSNGWKDSATNAEHFSTRIVVQSAYWMPLMKFKVTWARFAYVDQTYGVVPYGETADSDDEHSATFELPIEQAANVPPNDMLPAFVLMGHDTSAMPLSIECINASAPTADAAETIAQPVTASADECNLGARWMLTNPYSQLSDAEVRMDSWEAGRIVTLSFPGELLSISNVRSATVVDNIENGHDTVISFKLGQRGAGQVCNTGHVDEHGVFVRDTSCGVVSGGPEDEKVFAFQMAPGPKHAPHIECNDGSPPPPPDSGAVLATSASDSELHSGPNVAPGATEPLASLSPAHTGIFVWRPPPAPAHAALLTAPLGVDSDAACHAGGSAEVLRRTKHEEQETIRIRVKPNVMWPTGYGYAVGMKGLELEITQIDGATQIEKRSSRFTGTNLDALHSFVFLPQPSGTSFEFDAHGVDMILVSLTCRCDLIASLPCCVSFLY